MAPWSCPGAVRVRAGAPWGVPCFGNTCSQHPQSPFCGMFVGLCIQPLSSSPEPPWSPRFHLRGLSGLPPPVTDVPHVPLTSCCLTHTPPVAGTSDTQTPHHCPMMWPYHHSISLVRKLRPREVARPCHLAAGSGCCLRWPLCRSRPSHPLPPLPQLKSACVPAWHRPGAPAGPSRLCSRSSTFPDLPQALPSAPSWSRHVWAPPRAACLLRLPPSVT